MSSPTLRLVLVLVVAIAGSAAQEIAGTYVLMGDSDGTKPKTGARLELTFSTVKGGSVRLFATRPGETVRDVGTFSLSDNHITIHFKEVDWAAENQPFQLDGCVLRLPFMAVSASTNPGTSEWRRQEQRCVNSGSPGPAAVASSPPKTKFAPFSADEIITEDGQQHRLRIYVTEKAVRSERVDGGQPDITLVRFDRNLIWTWTPNTKMYSETSVDFGGGGGAAALRQTPAGSACSVVGEEQVGSYHCSKELCHRGVEGKDYPETRWKAKELDGLVVKYAESSLTIELSNIKLGPPDQSLFELPPGFQKAGK